MSPTQIDKKLRLKEGQKVLIINAPQDYTQILGTIPEGVTFVESNSRDVDFVHLFVHNKAELEKFIDTALKSIRYDGLLWISYPKGSAKAETDINRDSLWDLLLEKKIRPVTQISINDTWSAVRFRPTEAVGT